ncbi:OstA-like protein [Fodinibius saliphilus]|uniref:OstA-like protein n=1 Tax=Fodinibius saliphilus TaxID=1920650 RepID=UPI00110995D0|nr:OstA-like protein [Fodinibius saliphilus]
MRDQHCKLTLNHSRLAAIFVGLFLISLLPEYADAQNKVNILKADSIVGGSYNGERVQKILGDVRLRSQNMEMLCDSAYQFVNKSEMRAFGNIQIDTEDEMIWADSLKYFTDIDFSQLRGRVVIETDSTTLFGNSVDYRFTTKVAHFLDDIRFEDEQGILLANSGFYYRKADSAVFRGHVQLKDSLKYLEGDSLFTNRSSEYYEMYGNVFGDDQENKTMIQGRYLESDSTGRSLLKEEAWLKNFKSDTTDSTRADTTHIQAQKILSSEQRTERDTTTVIHGYENVRIWSPDFSALSDTTQYTDSTDTFELWSNAKSWHKQVQLTGPYIKAKIIDGNIDSLKSYPRPFSVQQDTTLERLNQITGDTLHADFNEGDLRQIYVFGNAHLLRFSKNEEGDPDGAIDMIAPDIRIFFQKGKLVKMKGIGAINGSYLPESKQTANKKLEGFSWDPKKRPKRPETPMQRRFAPISEQVFFDLPRRYIKYLKKTDPKNSKLKSESPKKELNSN